ncbi:MAG: hypothetical protein AAF467_24740 [Actinomycetota bacterium]
MVRFGSSLLVAALVTAACGTSTQPESAAFSEGPTDYCAALTALFEAEEAWFNSDDASVIATLNAYGTAAEQAVSLAPTDDQAAELQVQVAFVDAYGGLTQGEREAAPSYEADVDARFEALAMVRAHAEGECEISTAAAIHSDDAARGGTAEEAAPAPDVQVVGCWVLDDETATVELVNTGDETTTFGGVVEFFDGAGDYNAQYTSFEAVFVSPGDRVTALARTTSTGAACAAVDIEAFTKTSFPTAEDDRCEVRVVGGELEFAVTVDTPAEVDGFFSTVIGLYDNDGTRTDIEYVSVDGSIGGEVTEIDRRPSRDRDPASCTVVANVP